MSSSLPRRPATVVPIRPLGLLARLRARDPDAAAEVFDLYASSVERAVHGVMGLDPDAEDLVQDAFVAALEGIDGFRGEAASLGPWIRGIAVRLALKRIRWRRARSWLTRRGSEALPTLSALTDTDTQAALGRAYAALDRLPAAQRAAFGLRFIAGMQLDEVADALGVSLATAKRRIRTARDRFATLASTDTLLLDWLSRTGGRT